MFCDKIASEVYFLNKMPLMLENAAASHDIRNPTDFITVSEELKT
jgi:hypothetical protein